MSVASAIQSGRHAAEMVMRDTFMAKEPTGTTTNPDGFEVDNYTDRGTTKGRVKGQSQQSRDTYTRTVSIGGVDLPVVEGGLSIPITSYVSGGVLALKGGRVGEGWELVCTAVGPGSDPALKGSRWLVVNVPIESTVTARRLDVVRLPS